MISVGCTHDGRLGANMQRPYVVNLERDVWSFIFLELR